MKHFTLLVLLVSCMLHAQLKNEVMDSLLLYGKHHDLIQLLKKQTKNDETFYQLALVHQDKGNYYHALINFEKSARLKKKFKYQFKAIKMNIALQRYQRAEQLLNELLQEYPNNEAIQSQQAKLYRRQHKFSKVIKAYRELSNQFPENMDYAYGLGLAFMSKKKFNNAIDQLLVVYEKDSTHFNSIYRLAQAFQELRLPDSTYVFVRKGKKLRPDYKNLNQIYIKQLHRDKRYNEAIEVLERQDTLYPNEFFNKKMLGICYYNLPDYDKAKKHFSAAVDLNPDDHKSYTYLGHIALKEEKFVQAFKNYFEATIAAKIPREKEYYGLGMTSIAMDELEKAQYYLERAYQENRRDPLIVFELAKILDHNTKGGKEAYHYFKEYSIRHSNHNPENTAYASKRIKEIKEAYFLKGELLQ